MSFELAFKLSSYLLVLDGLLALWLTRLFDPFSFALILAVATLSWWSERLQAALSKRLWDTLVLLALPFLILDLFYLAESFIAGVVHLLVFITLYKLFNRRQSRDYLDLAIVSFFQLVAASALTISFTFFFAFLAYMVIGTWTFILLHLKREAETSSTSPQELWRSARLFGPRFFLFSLGTALGAFVLTLGFFLIMPRVGRAYIPLRWRAGTMVTGFSEKVELGAFGTIQTDPTIVMRVRLPDLDRKEAAQLDLRWRGVAFDRFDGRSWSVSDAVKQVLLRRREGVFFVARPRDGSPALKQEIYLEPIGAEALFAAPKAIGVSGDFPSLLVDSLGAIALSAPPLSRIRYLAFSQLEGPPPPQPPTPTPQPLTPNPSPYLQLPELSPRIRALASSIVEGTTTSYEKAKKVEAYLLSNYRYSLDLRRDPRFEPIEDFLFEQKSGNCEYFAASMTVLLRSVGVPARVVNGFQKGEWNEFGGYYAVRQRDAHSWVEVYLGPSGWLTFDPSPRAGFEVESQASSGFLARYLDSLRMRWNRYVIDYNLGDQVLLARALKKRSEALRDELSGSMSALKGKLRRLWVKAAPLGVGGWGLGAGVALLALAIFLRSKGGGSRHRLRNGLPRVPFYERALKLLARRGFVKEPQMTPREFAKRLKSYDGEVFAGIDQLFELYYRVRFGGRPLSPPEESQVKALLAQLQSRHR